MSHPHLVDVESVGGAGTAASVGSGPVGPGPVGSGPVGSGGVARGGPVRLRPVIDTGAAAGAVADLLRALGRDPSAAHLADTPRRVADAYEELLTPRRFDLTTFPNDSGYNELVLARDIPMTSLCEHHMLPFRGVAHVAYLPGENILGLSKLARVVELFARDLQVQERLTMQVADWLDDHLHPRGVGVVIEAEHMCMSIRGVHADGTRTTTSAVRGALRDNAATRREFLDLIHH